MTKRERFVFLDAKRKLMAPFLRGDSALNYEMMFSRAEMHRDKIPDRGWRELDKSLEESIAEELLSENETWVRSELRKTFGFASFGEEPLKQLQAIEQTEKISNEDEAKLVSDFLAGSYRGWAASPDLMRKLNDILSRYERGS